MFFWHVNGIILLSLQTTFLWTEIMLSHTLHRLMRMAVWVFGLQEYSLLPFFYHKWRKGKAEKIMSSVKAKWKRVCQHVKHRQRQSLLLGFFAYSIQLGICLFPMPYSFLCVESSMHNELMKSRPIIMSLQKCHCFCANWLHPPYSKDAFQP